MATTASDDAKYFQRAIAMIRNEMRGWHDNDVIVLARTFAGDFAARPPASLSGVLCELADRLERARDGAAR